MSAGAEAVGFTCGMAVWVAQAGKIASALVVEVLGGGQVLRVALELRAGEEACRQVNVRAADVALTQVGAWFRSTVQCHREMQKWHERAQLSARMERAAAAGLEVPMMAPEEESLPEGTGDGN